VAKRHPSAATMRFFGFDSFQGLPEIDGVDKSKNDDFYEGQYSCSYDSVLDSLNRAGGVDWKRTFLTKGYFSESLTEARRAELNLQRIAIALVDCDLYSSTAEVLAFIEPNLMDKSILMMDDWNCFDEDNERGQRKAFNEWMAMHPTWKREELFQYGHWGCVFLLRKG
jgi:O-methyltransferase